MSNHYGGLGGGHYTANVKNLANGRWYHQDDSSSTPIANPHSIRNDRSAYLLFYKRKTAKFKPL